MVTFACTQGHGARPRCRTEREIFTIPSSYLGPSPPHPHATSFHPCGHFGDRCHDLHFADGETEVRDQARVISESLMWLALTASLHSHLMPSAGAVGAEERTANPGAVGWRLGAPHRLRLAAGKVRCLHGLGGLGRPGCWKGKPSARNLIPFLGSFSNCHLELKLLWYFAQRC